MELGIVFLALERYEEVRLRALPRRLKL